MKYWMICLGLLIAGLLPIHAGQIVCDAITNRICVSGFPEENPATLTDILDADQKAGWGKLTYDQATDTFALQASLWIGTNTDWGTFFQIGRTNHLRETLILHGDLVVTAPTNSGRLVKQWADYDGSRSDHRYRVSNRLTLGDASHSNICPTVKIACSRKNEFSVRVLVGPEPKSSEGRWHYAPIGEWYMFHAVLTAATPDTNHTYTAAINLSHAGANYRMKDSTFAWWDGALFSTVYIAVRGLDNEDHTVRGMTFENGGSAANPFWCVDCVFKNLAVARVDAGAMRCVFEGNQENIQLTPAHCGMVFTDCSRGAPRKPLHLPRSTRDEPWLRNNSVYKQASDLKLVLNPGLVERISLPVLVTDRQGRPVKEAAVIVDCPDDREGLAVIRDLAVTDAEGLTPAEAEGRAIVITKRALQPTDDPARPKEIHYVYQLRVQAPGYVEHREMIQPSAAPLPRPLRITLKKQGMLGRILSMGGGGCVQRAPSK